ncbi:Failed axon connections [Amphibalanus amphitrite]|uniref:Failed axon connections n=1 Tax=Amphibalanus amphitrite TaxID=1232801 RepID=A0A6A4VUT7_AMPAM|nr:failed axon connections homolog [Amphibalanus amphitrite]KAF0293161.1 Failed axon connections [Amphibalanus amphitrite]
MHGGPGPAYSGGGGGGYSGPPPTVGGMFGGGGGGGGPRFGSGGLRSACREVADSPACRRLLQLALGAAAVGIGVKLYTQYRRRQRRAQWAQQGKDVVVLHTYPRGTTVPNISPFALKIETYCRMAGIAYVIDTEEPMGGKLMSPWITINGEEINDSELILDYLEKHFNKPVAATEKLTPAQRAVGRITQVMLDEHTMGLIAMKRYVIDNMEYMATILPAQLKKMVIIYKLFFSGVIKKRMWLKGVGRFTEPEVLFFLYRDLQALADTLGKQPYLLGNEPTTYDAAAFSLLAQALCATAPEVEVQVRQKHDNLCQYFDRMKSKFWSDWDQVLAQ